MKKILAILALSTLTACNTLSADKPAIIASMTREIGRTRPADCPSKWCACYLDKKLAAHGHKKRGSHRARDFASYGRATGAHRGAIMVQPHHVGIVTGVCSDGRIQAISGNHSRRVGIGCYRRSTIIAFRSVE